MLHWFNDGYAAYAAMHQHPANRFIHGLGMPFVVYGAFLLWICLSSGALGRTASLGLHSAIRVSAALLFSVYTGYYALFDVAGAALSVLVYFAPAALACMVCQRQVFAFSKGAVPLGPPTLLKRGALWILISLVFQEFVGHNWFENNHSDLSLVLTSITMAPLFGARALFGVA